MVTASCYNCCAHPSGSVVHSYLFYKFLERVSRVSVKKTCGRLYRYFPFICTYQRLQVLSEQASSLHHLSGSMNMFSEVVCYTTGRWRQLFVIRDCRGIAKTKVHRINEVLSWPKLIYSGKLRNSASRHAHFRIIIQEFTNQS